MKLIRRLSVSAPALRLLPANRLPPRTAGEALEDSLGLYGWLAGPGLWVDPRAVLIDQELASAACEQCLVPSTLAVPVHHRASQRYRVFSVCPNCHRLGEV